MQLHDLRQHLGNSGLSLLEQSHRALQHIRLGAVARQNGRRLQQRWDSVHVAFSCGCWRTPATPRCRQMRVQTRVEEETNGIEKQNTLIRKLRTPISLRHTPVPPRSVPSLCNFKYSTFSASTFVQSRRRGWTSSDSKIKHDDIMIGRTSKC